MEPSTTHERAEQLLCYLPEYRVIICRVHGAVRNWDTHLWQSHSIPKKIRDQIGEQHRFNQLPCYLPTEIPLPLPYQPPIALVGDPALGYACKNQGCSYISTSINTMKKHCNKKHNQVSTPSMPYNWQAVQVQTFFKTGGFQRYFIVARAGTTASSKPESGYAPPTTSEATSIITEWTAAQQVRSQQLDIAEAAIAATDRTGWFNRNGWPEHLAGRNLARLSWASRMPDKNDALFQQAVKIVDRAIEQGVAGLSTLPLETRRWLRSPKERD
jgi:hypothetical protein